MATMNVWVTTGDEGKKLAEESPIHGEAEQAPGKVDIIIGNVLNVRMIIYFQ